MYQKLMVFWLLCLTFTAAATAQTENNETIKYVENDTIQKNQYQFSYKQLIIPSTLILYGTVEASLASKYRLLNFGFGHEVANHKPEKFQIDDITQYVPAASVYALNLAGIKGKHNLKDRTVILGTAALFTAITVNSLKYTLKEQRPDKSAANSFPSGHTAMAFMGAEFLWKEYKDASIWYGIAGYALAAGTGAFRVYNNKHWAGDVIFGAGLGMLCTKAAYWLFPTVQNIFYKKKNLVLLPYYNGQQTGLAFSLNI
jgi:membrane-associated phospholipid phosphatase